MWTKSFHMGIFEINFRLRPVEEIEPWGPEPHLHHFGLTHGCYWIRCGEEELFRYTDEILNYWRNERLREGFTSNWFGEPYDDYQVMRIDDDLEDTLPYALEPVPADVAGQKEWIQKLRYGARPPADVLRRFRERSGGQPSAIDDLIDRATEWWNQRAVPVFHLKFNPVLHIWRTGNSIHIEYDTRDARDEGIRVWTAGRGAIELSVDEFVAAVRSFRERFVGEMRQRVDEVSQNWSRPGVQIDLEELARNQDVMERSLAATCTQRAETDWKDAREAITEIERRFAIE